MGLKLCATLVALLVIWIAYSWIDRFDTAMVQGKRVLVTGASTGIGEQLAYQYARLGANVMITARREEALQKVVAKCNEISGKSHNYVTGDMSKLEDTATIIKAAQEKLGGLDILVINHVSSFAFAWFQGKENLTFFNYKTTVNYMSYVHMAVNALPLLRNSPGSSIVVIGSVIGIIGLPVNSEYAGSKFAVRGFFQSLGEQFEITGQDTSVTMCNIGATDTENALRAMQTESIAGKNFSKAAGIPFAKASSAALAVVKAGALKEDEMFYPYFFRMLKVPGFEWLIRYLSKRSYIDGWNEIKGDNIS